MSYALGDLSYDNNFNPYHTDGKFSRQVKKYIIYVQISLELVILINLITDNPVKESVVLESSVTPSMGCLIMQPMLGLTKDSKTTDSRCHTVQYGGV